VPAGGAGKTWNIGGKVLTAGLVDPHTHIVLARRPWSFSRCRRKVACAEISRVAAGALNPPHHPDGYACQVRAVKCGAFGMLV
jgi:hypothetical protein